MNINVFLCDDPSAIDKMRERLAKYSDITVFEFSSFDEFVNRYILKSEVQELIEKQINDNFSDNCDNNRVLIIRTDENNETVKLEDISYITVLNHTSVLHTTDGKIYQMRLSLKKLLERRLDKMFVRCHRGYIVNLRHIKDIQKNKVILNNSVLIEIGRAYKADILKKYNMFIQRKLK